MSKSVRLTTVAPAVSESPPEWVTVAALRSRFALPPVIGKLAVVPESVAGPMIPGVTPRLASAPSVDASSASAVEPWASSWVWDGCALTTTLPSGRPALNALTPNTVFSVVAAVRLSSAVRPRTFVPKPERETFGVPTRLRIFTRPLPTFADSVIRPPTLTT